MHTLPNPRKTCQARVRTRFSSSRSRVARRVGRASVCGEMEGWPAQRRFELENEGRDGFAPFLCDWSVNQKRCDRIHRRRSRRASEKTSELAELEEIQKVNGTALSSSPLAAWSSFSGSGSGSTTGSGSATGSGSGSATGSGSGSAWATVSARDGFRLQHGFRRFRLDATSVLLHHRCHRLRRLRALSSAVTRLLRLLGGFFSMARRCFRGNLAYSAAAPSSCSPLELLRCRHPAAWRT